MQVCFGTGTRCNRCGAMRSSVVTMLSPQHIIPQLCWCRRWILEAMHAAQLLQVDIYCGTLRLEIK